MCFLTSMPMTFIRYPFATLFILLPSITVFLDLSALLPLFHNRTSYLVWKFHQFLYVVLSAFIGSKTPPGKHLNINICWEVSISSFSIKCISSIFIRSTTPYHNHLLRDNYFFNLNAFHQFLYIVGTLLLKTPTGLDLPQCLNNQ